jgi:SAM-dependent methyltransferase
MSEEPWYVDLFRGGDYYRGWADVIGPELTAQQVEFVVEALDLPEGARPDERSSGCVLDLCCGPGRHAVPLAQRGFDVTGLDLSAYHLRLARKAAREAGVKVRWLRRDMRDIPFEGEFNAVINMFTAFGYFEDEEEDFKVLEAVSRALKPGGRFFIDTMNREWVVRHYQETNWRQHEDGLITMERRKLDLLTSRNESVWMLIAPDGERRVHRLSPRLYTLTELAKMLSRAGLSVRRTWGGFDGREYGLDSRRMIVLAEKAG